MSQRNAEVDVLEVVGSHAQQLEARRLGHGVGGCGRCGLHAALPAQVGTGEGGPGHKASEVAVVLNLATALTRAGAHVDDPVGRLHHRRVVLHHQQAVASVAQAVHDIHQPLQVAGV